jgi:hypothetical protein
MDYGGFLLKNHWFKSSPLKNQPCQLQLGDVRIVNPHKSVFGGTRQFTKRRVVVVDTRYIIGDGLDVSQPSFMELMEVCSPGIDTVHGGGELQQLF